YRYQQNPVCSRALRHVEGRRGSEYHVPAGPASGACRRSRGSDARGPPRLNGAHDGTSEIEGNRELGNRGDGDEDASGRGCSDRRVTTLPSDGRHDSARNRNTGNLDGAHYRFSERIRTCRSSARSLPESISAGFVAGKTERS